MNTKQNPLLGIGLMLAACLAFWALSAGVVPGGSAPFPADKLCVLIVTESSKPNTVTREQLVQINSTAARALVGMENFKVYDPDSSPELDMQWALDALAVPRTSIPWLYVSNGRSGYSGPLPANEAALLELLKKHGG